MLSGGRTEPIEKYFEVIEDLTGRGYVVLAHDWRGQGLSHRSLTNRLAGHADGYQAFLDDYHALLAKYESRLPKRQARLHARYSKAKSEAREQALRRGSECLSVP